MGKRILIADDEPNIVVALVFLMKQMGHEVRVATTGEEAANAVAEFNPDLILLDVMMPRMSGYDLCQSVRDDPDRHGVKIIMLSAKGRDVDVTKGIAIGADAYFTKPFSTKELTAKVQQLLSE